MDAGGPGMKPFQFAIDYPKMAGVVGPGGYSGAMVWYDKANCGTVDQLQQDLLSVRAASSPTTIRYTTRCCALTPMRSSDSFASSVDPASMVEWAFLAFAPTT